MVVIYRSNKSSELQEYKNTIVYVSINYEIKM